MILELTTGNIIFIIAALLGAFWALLKLIAVQHERSLDKRFLELAATINLNQELTRRLEQDLMILQGEIPRSYLRRDDYLHEMQAMKESMKSQLDPIRHSVESIRDFLLNQKS